MKRILQHVYTPHGHPGFLGAGHIARPVINGSYSKSDPFIMLMDDILDKKDNIPVGGPHPHAGFETVTLVLEGEVGLIDDHMKPGDLQIMTAGSGVVHTEVIEKPTRMRILQMWLTLPEKHRWAPPRVQDLKLEDVPVKSENGSVIRVYSGSFAGLTSPISNYVPLIIADINLEPGVSIEKSLPADFNTFMYVIEGSVTVGEDKRLLHQDQVGWLDVSKETSESELILTGGETGGRIILYGGKAQGDRIVSHGPFIGSSEEDIPRLYKEYRMGMMKHVQELEK